MGGPARDEQGRRHHHFSVSPPPDFITFSHCSSASMNQKVKNLGKDYMEGFANIMRHACPEWTPELALQIKEVCPFFKKCRLSRFGRRRFGQPKHFLWLHLIFGRWKFEPKRPTDFAMLFYKHSKRAVHPCTPRRPLPMMHTHAPTHAPPIPPILHFNSNLLYQKRPRHSSGRTAILLWLHSSGTARCSTSLWCTHQGFHRWAQW